MRAGRPSREAGGDHRLAESLQRAGYVDALAARHRALIHRAMATAELEVGHGERLVDRRVQRDRDDHPDLEPTLRRAWMAGVARYRTPHRLAKGSSRRASPTAAPATPL